MSDLRPTLHSGSSATCVVNGTAYLMILQAVRAGSGLIHGKPHYRGKSCAIGRFFDVNRELCLQARLIDEVTAVNDSVPGFTERARNNPN